MIKLTAVALAAALLAPSIVAAAEPAPSCADSPARVGACFTVRGRLTHATGIPNLRLWIVGTKRILGIHGAAGTPRDEKQLPEVLARWIYEGGDDPPHSRAAFGDFTVCPLTPDEPGVMRRVCVVSAARLVYRSDFDW